MKRVAMFACVTAVVVIVAAWIVTLVASVPGVSRAVWTSAAIAIVVQVAGFALTRAAQATNVVAGWGSAMLLRVLALAAYGFLAAPLFGFALAPALLSLAGFFFLTTIIEPAFLKP